MRKKEFIQKNVAATAHLFSTGDFAIPGHNGDRITQCIEYWINVANKLEIMEIDFDDTTRRQDASKTN